VPATLRAVPRLSRLAELTYPFHDSTIAVTSAADLFQRPEVNLSHVFAAECRVTQVGERIWLVTFMQYDLGTLTMRRAARTDREPVWTETVTYRRNKVFLSVR